MGDQDFGFALEMRPTFRDFLGRFTRANDELLNIRAQEMLPESKRFEAIIKDEAPKRSGEFAAAITTAMFVEQNAVGFRAYMPSPLKDYIIKGTRPHIIAAKNAQALRFFWERGPHGPGIYYFKSVNHPGTNPNRFPGRAYRRWLPGARVLMRRIATRYARYLGG